MANGSLESAYELESTLGRGAFGVVVKARRKADDEACACKRVPLSGLNEDARRKALQEARLLSELSSPFILRYFDSFIEADELYIITQFCDGGTLHELIELHPRDVGLGESTACRLAAQILSGLAHLHARCVLHRDVKPANIFLLKGGGALLGDLGVAKVLLASFDHAQTLIGSPAYMAPEVVDAKPYGAASDIWAFGIVLFQMCMARRPFEAANIPALYAKIMECRVPPLQSSYSIELRALAANCMRRVPTRRPDAAELLRTAPIRAAVQRLGGEAAEQLRTAVPISSGISPQLGSAVQRPIRGKQLFGFAPPKRGVAAVRHSASQEGKLGTLEVPSPTGSMPRKSARRSGSCVELSLKGTAVASQDHAAIIAALSKGEVCVGEEVKRTSDGEEDSTIRPDYSASQRERLCPDSCVLNASVQSSGQGLACHLRDALVPCDSESTMRPELLASQKSLHATDDVSENCLQETLLAHRSLSPADRLGYYHGPRRSLSEGNLHTHRLAEQQARWNALSRPPLPDHWLRSKDLKPAQASAEKMNASHDDVESSTGDLNLLSSVETPSSMDTDSPTSLGFTTTVFALTGGDSLALSNSTANSVALGLSKACSKHATSEHGSAVDKSSSAIDATFGHVDMDLEGSAAAHADDPVATGPEQLGRDAIAVAEAAQSVESATEATDTTKAEPDPSPDHANSMFASSSEISQGKGDCDDEECTVRSVSAECTLKLEPSPKAAPKASKALLEPPSHVAAISSVVLGSVSKPDVRSSGDADAIGPSSDVSPQSTLTSASLVISPTAVAIDLGNCFGVAAKYDLGATNLLKPCLVDQSDAKPCLVPPLVAFRPRPLVSPTSVSVRASNHPSSTNRQSPPSSVSSRATARSVRSVASPQCAAGRAGVRQRSKAYVAKAQECWGRWRREKLEARAAEKGGKNASVGNGSFVAQHSVVAEDDDVLEVRGFAAPRTPCTPASNKHAARGSLVAARVLYTPPAQRRSGTRV